MGQWPSIAALARAKPEQVLKKWEGLGYYTRARNLHKAAKLVVDRHGGKFPRHFENILALPGIGRYTAGAICSIAFNQPEPILDGNVIRVLARVFGIEGDPRQKFTNAQLWAAAKDLVTVADEAAQAGERNCSCLNQALMELGALVCARQPKCQQCPVRKDCVAHRSEQIPNLPGTARRAPMTARRFAAIVAEHRGRFLVRQRPAGVVNAHLWEFPNIELAINDADPQNAHVLTLLGGAPAVLENLCVIKHSITRYRITLEVYRTVLQRRPGRIDPQSRWLTKQKVEALAFASAHRKILEQL